eukprot:TRINITY_DN2772_c0_g1_i2.p2 TRINITY_DN2772_c0_g1~~TRINITY_DN2772_c0_g1_i2.p2  ORF type:complete len:371 (+),score=60.60 TRINITY_DN2772_c0_g1_i2:164-1114(+)
MLSCQTLLVLAVCAVSGVAGTGVCNAYTPETPCQALAGVCYNAGTCQCETHFDKAECLVDPCSVNKCDDGYECRSNNCGGCHHQCLKIVATPAPVPTPVPTVCDAYTPETPCKALAGVCYNAGTCQCETHFDKTECLVDPCSVNKCDDGYECRSNNCGGCHHQCLKIETPAPVCNAYTPETPCKALAGVCYNAGTCQCETHFDKTECLVDPCSVNKCDDGYECRSNNCGGCHHQCLKIVATPAPVPTPVPTVCDAYTPETPCKALAGVCYNAGTCTCGFYTREACWFNPCWWSVCASGYECRPNNCGGCGYQCLRI